MKSLLAWRFTLTLSWCRNINHFLQTLTRSTETREKIVWQSSEDPDPFSEKKLFSEKGHSPIYGQQETGRYSSGGSQNKSFKGGKVCAHKSHPFAQTWVDSKLLLLSKHHSERTFYPRAEDHIATGNFRARRHDNTTRTDWVTVSVLIEL